MLTRTAERAEDLVNGEIEFGGRRGRLASNICRPAVSRPLTAGIRLSPP